jgi:serine/threonine-protein kinase
LALAAGASLGPYRIIEPLGRGGMASVYKAYEAALDRYVAVKVLPPEFLHDPTFAERFRREAKVVARLEHPNVIPIFAFDISEGGIPWMAMRFIAGGTVSGLLRGSPGRLPRERVIAILRGVADALDYAHGKGVIHRDVKPHNVLIDEGGRIYLVDFGVAKMVETSSGLTATGMISGTPQYMAPEQITALTVDHRADIYSLGIVAYELLTGRVPFAADTPIAVLMKHVSDPIPLPSPDEVPEPMVRALLKCTAKKPEDRWPTTGAFVDALEKGKAEAEALAGVPHVPTTVDLRVPALSVLPGPPVSPAAPSPGPTPPAGPAAPGTHKRRFPAVTLLFVLGLAGFVYLTEQELIPWSWLASVLFPESAGTTSPPGPELAAPGSGPVADGPPVRGAAPLPTPSLAVSPPSSLPGPLVTADSESTGGPPPTVQSLLESLGDSDPDKRGQAAKTLGSLGGAAREAVPALTVALKDREGLVRTEAARALGRIGPEAKSAVPALNAALKDREPLVAREAAEALKRIAGASGSF